MENIIKKIEEYQAQNKIKYDAAMAKPFNEIVFDLAGLIGNFQAQLEIIKIELENGKYIQLEQEFKEYRDEFKYCIKDMEYCFKDARAGEDGEAKYFTFTDYINRFKK